MRRIFLAAVLLVFALNAFPFSQPAFARSPKIPRGFDLYTQNTIDGCTYDLYVRLYEYNQGEGTLIVDMESTCFSGWLTYYGDLSRKEYRITGSLKSASLKATILDEPTGKPVVAMDLQFRAIGNKPSDYFTPALVTGTVIFPEMGLTFSFDNDQVGGIWYGT